MARTARTQGTVVGYEDRPHPTGEAESRYRPVVEFTTADGQLIHATAKGGQSWKIARSGATVRVSYDPANPLDCAASTALTRGVGWFIAGVFAAVVVVMLVVALVH